MLHSEACRQEAGIPAAFEWLFLDFLPSANRPRVSGALLAPFSEMALDNEDANNAPSMGPP